MQDDRIREAHGFLREADTHLERAAYNVRVVTSLLDDARTLILDIVDECRPPYPKSVNCLDASRTFINSALKLIDRGWAASEAQVFVRSAMDQLEYAQQPEGAA